MTKAKTWNQLDLVCQNCRKIQKLAQQVVLFPKSKTEINFINILLWGLGMFNPYDLNKRKSLSVIPMRISLRRLDAVKAGWNKVVIQEWYTLHKNVTSTLTTGKI